MLLDVPPSGLRDLRPETQPDNLLILLGLGALLVVAVVVVLRRWRKGGGDGAAGD